MASLAQEMERATDIENHGDFAKAFHEISLADIRRAAAIEL